MKVESKISPSVINVDECRVPTNENTSRPHYDKEGFNCYGKYNDFISENSDKGRFPPNLFIDKEATKIIDKQSGVLKSGDITGSLSGFNKKEGSLYGSSKMVKKYYQGNQGGASKILHHIDYTEEEISLLNKQTFNYTTQGQEMNPEINLRCNDVLDDIKTYPDYFFNTIFGDFPYALGMKWNIDKKTGHYVPKGGLTDFMNRWQCPTPQWWDEFFGEAFRVMKHGAYLVFYSIDRQQDVFTYYARRNGFEVCQSIYWLFISSFPKALDVSKVIDRKLGKEREVVGSHKKAGDIKGGRLHAGSNEIGVVTEILHTQPSSDLAKTFDGYKAGIAPLKSVLETIVILRKPLKNSSIVDDIMEWDKDMQNSKISPSVIDVENCRVPIKNLEDEPGYRPNAKNHSKIKFNEIYGKYDLSSDKCTSDEGYHSSKGRFPPNMFADSEAKKSLDKQSGVLKSAGEYKKEGVYEYENKDMIRNWDRKYSDKNIFAKDEGGASRILHTCDYTEKEFDIVRYCPKVSNAERELGLSGFEENYKLKENISNEIIEEIKSYLENEKEEN